MVEKLRLKNFLVSPYSVSVDFSDIKYFEKKTLAANMIEYQLRGGFETVETQMFTWYLLTCGRKCLRRDAAMQMLERRCTGCFLLSRHIDRAPDRLVERGADGAPMQWKDSSTSVKTWSDTSRPGLSIYRQPSNSYEPLGPRLTGFLLSYRTKPWIGVKGWLPVELEGCTDSYGGLGLNVIFHSCLIGPSCGQSYCPVCPADRAADKLTKHLSPGNDNDNLSNSSSLAAAIFEPAENHWSDHAPLETYDRQVIRNDASTRYPEIAGAAVDCGQNGRGNHAGAVSSNLRVEAPEPAVTLELEAFGECKKK
ncbi:hypothetical protein K0M31_002152 [Melipona bicolor]|uniref:Uncharacterized protein n=1 Tax=Melipona bicolor TaxID=60889 RepID=A0AA40GH79_9HYME|nr:hypothetical protein K0M31_002152 [Melipona bicolor]